MDDFRRKIRLADDRIIEYHTSVDFGKTTIIRYSVIKDDNVSTISFHRGWDYSFNSYYTAYGYSELENIKCESHIIDKTNPLYIPLLHLLNGEDELIIDDDETREINQKYMRINFDGENVIVEFINNLDMDYIPIEKFNIFIKNICADVRSKIDCADKDTKERLFFFFSELADKFQEEDTHQMTIEEYLLDNDLLTLEDTKVFVKKLKI